MSTVWTSSEKDELKEKYGCEILIECGSIDQVKSNKYPSDAYIVKYELGDKFCYDLTRGTKSDLFDIFRTILFLNYIRKKNTSCNNTYYST